MSRPVRDIDEIITAFRDGEVTLRANRRQEGFTNALQEIGYQGVRKNDLVIHAMDAFAGAIGVSDSDGKSTPVYSVCSPSSDNTVSSYYGSLLRYMATSGYINSLAKGIRERSTDFRWSDAGNVLVPIPSKTEQASIVYFIYRETSKIDALIEEQRRLIELLKEKRQAVISHAVTKSLNPTVPMKDSRFELLGDVPSEWTVIKLGRVLFMQEGPGLRHWQFTESGTRVICVTNITESGVDFSCLEKFISYDEYSSTYSHFTVETGDILLSSSGNSWGKVAVYESDEQVILNTSTIRLHEAKGSLLLRDFLTVLLKSDAVREQLRIAMTGSCQPNFGPSHLKTVIVALPPPDEQAKIVSFLVPELLGHDALVKTTNAAIELLQERRSALISAAVTGKVDVRNYAHSESAALEEVYEPA
jgi:type I restriction enzyme S subunit